MAEQTSVAGVRQFLLRYPPFAMAGGSPARMSASLSRETASPIGSESSNVTVGQPKTEAMMPVP